jgi:hypothetical protein
MSSSPTKKIVLVAASIVVLSVLILVFTNPWSTMGSSSRQVALKSPGEVDRIKLADPMDSTMLVREVDTWILNGTEEAGKVPVENLLIAAERLEINSIISTDPESGNTPGRIVSYYKGNKVLLSYELLEREGRYLITPLASENSYFVSVSGYPGLNLERVFSANSNHYREHLLIDLLPSEIAKIEIDLSDGTNFRFEQDRDGSVTCISTHNNTTTEVENMNEQAVRLLFSYFTSIVYEDKSGITASSLFQADSLPQAMALLHVESYGGEKHSLHVFPYVENQGDQAHMFKALVFYNNDPESLIVNYIYLDVLMRSLSHYVGDK